MRVNRLVVAVALLVAMSTFIASSGLADNYTSANANSKRESRQDVNRWVPAFALLGAFHGQSQKSSLSSSCDIGGPASSTDGALSYSCLQAGPDGRDDPPTPADTPTAMRDANDGEEFGVWPGVGIEVQLMTPRIPKNDILPFDIGIRGFVSGEVMAVFPPSRATANEGNPGELDFPDIKILDSYPATAIGGTGSELRSEPDTFEFAAAVGISIPMNVLNRTVRIKPSFGWLHYKLKLSGRVVHAIKDDVNGDKPGFGQPNGSFGTITREINIRKNVTKNINAIGTGVEIELESGKFGPIGATVFSSIHGYKVVGDRKFKFASSQSFADDFDSNVPSGLLADTYRANWEHEIDPWIYRMKVGLRFHYIGD